jgi:hypothetical protein
MGANRARRSSSRNIVGNSDRRAEGPFYRRTVGVIGLGANCCAREVRRCKIRHVTVVIAARCGMGGWPRTVETPSPSMRRTARRQLLKQSKLF